MHRGVHIDCSRVTLPEGHRRGGEDTTDTKTHWEAVYRAKAPEQVSWFRPQLELPLELIGRAALGPATAILDIGGGASTLAKDLLCRGYVDVSVLDISEAALTAARQQLAEQASRVRWICADVLEAALPARRYHICHDRAVFHFLQSPAERALYRHQVVRSLRPGGHLILAAFGPEGPEHCSGLPVLRYDAAALLAQFGPEFMQRETHTEMHTTPSGASQQFVYTCLQFVP